MATIQISDELLRLCTEYKSLTPVEKDKVETERREMEVLRAILPQMKALLQGGAEVDLAKMKLEVMPKVERYEASRDALSKVRQARSKLRQQIDRMVRVELLGHDPNTTKVARDDADVFDLLLDDESASEDMKEAV